MQLLYVHAYAVNYLNILYNEDIINIIHFLLSAFDWGLEIISIGLAQK